MFGSDVRELQQKAHALAGRGKIQDAVDTYRKVLKQQPYDLATRQKVGELLARAGRTGEAIHEYQHVVGAYAADGFLLKAMAICKVILQLDPAHVETAQTLADLCTQKQGGGARTLPRSMSGAVGRREKDAEPSAPIEWSDILDSGELAALNAHDGKAATPPPPPEDSGEEVIEIEDSAEVVLDASSVPHIPLFSDVQPGAFVAILEQMTLRAARAGDMLVREGEPGNSMFVVVQGRVGVLRNVDGGTRKVAEMGDGAFFGEMALLSSAPRLASVVAETESVILELGRERLQEIVKKHPSVGAVLDSFHKDRLLQNLLRSSPLFRPLSETERKDVVAAFQSITVPSGMELLRQGEQGDALYLLLRGECEAVTRATDGSTQQHPPMREGDVFGEISLLRGTPVTATVRTTAPCVLLSLSADVFNRLIKPHPEVGALVAKLGAERLERTVLAVPLDAEVNA